MEPESSSNVDVIRRAFSAWNARDPDARVVRVQAYLDPADAIEAMRHATRDTRR